MAKKIKEEIVDLGNGVELTMVLIPKGKFLMGSPQSEEYRDDDETQHEVTTSKPFTVGKFEVTQEPSIKNIRGEDQVWESCTQVLNAISVNELMGRQW